MTTDNKEYYTIVINNKNHFDKVNDYMCKINGIVGDEPYFCETKWGWAQYYRSHLSTICFNAGDDGHIEILYGENITRDEFKLLYWHFETTGCNPICYKCFIDDRLPIKYDHSQIEEFFSLL